MEECRQLKAAPEQAVSEGAIDPEEVSDKGLSALADRMLKLIRRYVERGEPRSTYYFNN